MKRENGNDGPWRCGNCRSLHDGIEEVKECRCTKEENERCSKKDT
jgi:hypothetical protein